MTQYNAMPKTTQASFSVGVDAYKADNLQPITVDSFDALLDTINQNSMDINHLVPRDLTVQTPAEFDRLPEKVRLRAKTRGNYLTAGMTTNGRRRRADMFSVGLLILDIDEGDVDIADLRAALPEYPHVGWDTFSSRPGRKKWRVVFPLGHAMTPQQYEVAYKQFVETLPDEIRKHLDLSQGHAEKPAFLPVYFPKRSPATIIHSEGEWLDLRKYLPASHAVLDPEHDQHLAKPDWEHLRPPSPDVTPDEIRERLKDLDASPENDWIKAGRALHHQFSGSEEGFDIWREWSATCPEKYTYEVCRDRWDRMKQTGPNSPPTTWRSLDWDISHRQSESARERWERRIESCTDPDTLWDDYALAVSEDDLLVDDDRESLAKTLKTRHRTLAKHTGHDTPPGKDWKGRTQAKALKPTTEEPIDEPNDLPVVAREIPTKDERPGGQAWKRYWVYVKNLEKFYNIRTGSLVSRTAFNDSMGRYIINPETGNPIMPPVNFALNRLQIEVVESIEFAPRQPVIYERDGDRLVNTWLPSLLPRGWDYDTEDLLGYQPTPLHDEVSQLFTKHLHRMFRPEDAEHLLDWISWVVQNEGRKAMWSPLINGVQGAGKTLLAEVICAVLGNANTKVISNDSINSGYTGWAEGAVLGVIEELKDAGGWGSSQYRTGNRLKQFITNAKVEVNEKYQPARQVHNTVNYIALTNHYHPISVDSAAERRWFLCECVIPAGSKLLALEGHDEASKHFQEVAKLKTGRKVLALRQWLYHRDIKHPPLEHAPHTDWWYQLVKSSKPRAEGVLDQLLMEDWPGYSRKDGLLAYSYLRDYIATEGFDGDYDPKTVLGTDHQVRGDLRARGWRELETKTARGRLLIGTKKDGKRTTVWYHPMRAKWLVEMMNDTTTSAKLRDRRIDREVKDRLKKTLRGGNNPPPSSAEDDFDRESDED